MGEETPLERLFRSMDKDGDADGDVSKLRHHNESLAKKQLY
jgi:hypothetical protein